MTSFPDLFPILFPIYTAEFRRYAVKSSGTEKTIKVNETGVL